MNATNVGVDRSGNFWFWDSTDLSVTAITPQGEHRTVDLSPDVQAIDVDRERGIVTLGHDSKSVRVTSFDGAVTSSFELSFLAASLCWMDGDRVAIAPSASPWLVEVWSTSSKSAMAMMGAVPEIKAPSAGAVLTRATLLRYDEKRAQLVTLDAFNGDLLVFDRSGEVVRRARITHPKLGANLLWLAELNARAKRTGEKQTPSLWNYPRMSLSQDSTVWLGERGDRTEAVTIARILPDGTVLRSAVDVRPCPSVRFEIWGDQLVFFRNSKATQRCVMTKEVKP